MPRPVAEVPPILPRPASLDYGSPWNPGPREAVKSFHVKHRADNCWYSDYHRQNQLGLPVRFPPSQSHAPCVPPRLSSIRELQIRTEQELTVQLPVQRLEAALMVTSTEDYLKIVRAKATRAVLEARKSGQLDALAKKIREMPAQLLDSDYRRRNLLSKKRNVDMEFLSSNLEIVSIRLMGTASEISEKKRDVKQALLSMVLELTTLRQDSRQNFLECKRTGHLVKLAAYVDSAVTKVEARCRALLSLQGESGRKRVYEELCFISDELIDLHYKVARGLYEVQSRADPKQIASVKTSSPKSAKQDKPETLTHSPEDKKSSATKKGSKMLLQGLRNGQLEKVVNNMEENGLAEPEKPADPEPKAPEAAAPGGSKKASKMLLQGLKDGRVAKIVDDMEAEEEQKQ